MQVTIVEALSLGRQALMQQRADSERRQREFDAAMERQRVGEWHEFVSAVVAVLPKEENPTGSELVYLDLARDTFVLGSQLAVAKIVFFDGGEVWGQFGRDNQLSPWKQIPWQVETSVETYSEFKWRIPRFRLEFADWYDEPGAWAVVADERLLEESLFDNDLGIALALAEEQGQERKKLEAQAKEKNATQPLAIVRPEEPEIRLTDAERSLTLALRQLTNDAAETAG